MFLEQFHFWLFSVLWIAIVVLLGEFFDRDGRGVQLVEFLCDF
jgi:hypothetical protein